MKALILLALSLTFITGCSSSRLQSVDDAESTISGHLEKVAMSKAFCDGQPLKYYYEISYHYSFTCQDGRSFTLRKD